MRKQLLNLKFLLMLCMIFCIGGGSVVAAEGDVFYTLSCVKNTSNSAYANYYDVTINELVWNAPGNQALGAYWRIGGKSLTNENRTITGKNSIDKNIGKVTLNHKGKSTDNLIVNSISLTVASDAEFANVIETIEKSTPDVSAAGIIDFEPTSGVWANGSYYKLTINVTTQSKNAGLDITSLVFYEGADDGSVPANLSLSITPGTNTFAKATEVSLSANVEGSKIYYTTDGTDPTASSTLYESPFSVTKSGTTVKAVAMADGYENATSEATYTIKPDQPVFSVESMMFKEAFDVTLSLPSTTDASSTIRYAIGSTATAESDVYNGPVNISAETEGDKVVLHAIVVDEYGNVGQEKYCTYTKTEATVFDFTQRPNVWGIDPISSNSSSATSNVVGKELDVDGIVMTSTSGTGSITCIFASSATSEPNLRVYNGGSITFTAPDGYDISEIKFTGSKLENFTSDSETYSNLTWTGQAHAVTFSASATVQVKTASIKTVPVSNPSTNTLTLVAQDGGMYYATFSSDKDVLFTEDVEVDAVTVSGTTMTVTELPKDEYFVKTNNADGYAALRGSLYYVPANTGVLIQSLTNTVSYYYPYESATVAVPDNMLKAAPAAGEFTAEDGYKYYKLAYNDYDTKTGLGFYWGATGGGAFSVKAGTAYLAVPTGVSNAKGFSFDGTTTGISAVGAEGTAKINEIYNIAGQRVNAMTKAGLYIVNGKKMVIKK